MNLVQGWVGSTCLGGSACDFLFERKIGTRTMIFYMGIEELISAPAKSQNLELFPSPPSNVAPKFASLPSNSPSSTASSHSSHSTPISMHHVVSFRAALCSPQSSRSLVRSCRIPMTLTLAVTISITGSIRVRIKRSFWQWSMLHSATVFRCTKHDSWGTLQTHLSDDSLFHAGWFGAFHAFDCHLICQGDQAGFVEAERFEHS